MPDYRLPTTETQVQSQEQKKRKEERAQATYGVGEEEEEDEITSSSPCYYSSPSVARNYISLLAHQVGPSVGRLIGQSIHSFILFEKFHHFDEFLLFNSLIGADE